MPKGRPTLQTDSGQARGRAMGRAGLCIVIALLAGALTAARMGATLRAASPDAVQGDLPTWATDKQDYFAPLLAALPLEPTVVGYVSEADPEMVTESGWYMLARYTLVPHRVTAGVQSRYVIVSLPDGARVDQAIARSRAAVLARPYPTLALLDLGEGSRP